MAERTYRIVFRDPEAFWHTQESFPEAQQERITEFLAGHLRLQPRVMHPPLLKQLRGSWSSTYQFECGGPRRLLYEVDDDTLTVTIIYLGGHPAWDRRNPLD